ncbi:MAG: PilZ domain-containing protein [Nitrospinota bacterium]
MEQRFQEGQAVSLRIETGRSVREYNTRILQIAAPYLTLKRPAKLDGPNGKKSRVSIHSAGRGGLSTQAEIQAESAPGVVKVRCLDSPQEYLQRREMVREADELPIRFRVISAGEYKRRKAHFEFGSYAGPGSGVGNKRMATPEPSGADSLVLECLREISRKLDRLIELMGEEEQEIALNYSGIVEDISGSGLRFSTHHPVPEDSFLEFRVGLIGRVANPVPGLAEVKRANEYVSLAGERHWEVAIHFTGISESDRDQIVAHILQKQRATIKNR